MREKDREVKGGGGAVFAGLTQCSGRPLSLSLSKYLMGNNFYALDV